MTSPFDIITQLSLLAEGLLYLKSQMNYNSLLDFHKLGREEIHVYVVLTGFCLHSSGMHGTGCVLTPRKASPAVSSLLYRGSL